MTQGRYARRMVTVRVYPALFGPLKQRGMLLAYRDSVLLRLFDPEASGNLWQEEAIDGLVGCGLHRATAYRMVNRAVQAGLVGRIWIAHEERFKLKFRSPAWLARELGLERLGPAVDIPARLLLSPRWYRALAGAAAAAVATPPDAATPRPITRATRRRIHGASPQTQRRGEALAGVQPVACWTILPDDEAITCDRGGVRAAPGLVAEQIGNVYWRTRATFHVQRRTRAARQRAAQAARPRPQRRDTPARRATTVTSCSPMVRESSTVTVADPLAQSGQPRPQRRTVALCQAVRLRPASRPWRDLPAWFSPRGGRERLYPLRIEQTRLPGGRVAPRIVLSPVGMLPEDWQARLRAHGHPAADRIVRRRTSTLPDGRQTDPGAPSTETDA